MVFMYYLRDMFKNRLVSCLTIFALLLFLFVSPVEAVAKKSVSWKWSDGVAAGSRSIAKSKYRSSDQVPAIVVTIKPKAIARIASLQYLTDDGEWAEEYRAQSESGQTKLYLNPMCDSGWCDGVITYRIVIEPSGDQPTYKPSQFKITYSNSSGSTSSGGSSSGSSSGGSSSGSSSGVSGAYFIGWNLEDVQDFVGFDPRTADCSGLGRSVWWASNWWVVNSYSGVLVVSKSPYRCS